MLAFAAPATGQGDSRLPPDELDPISERIDEQVELAAARKGAALAEPCSDTEFVRRLCLDLIGRIPTAEETRAFLEETDPHKRRRLVDRLLASPEHARHLQYVLDVMLMRRLPHKHVQREPWRQYLYESASTNKSWRLLAEELLSAEGAPEGRAAARFLLDRELKQEQVTRDIGRVFLGRDLQCAQCHDHPHLDDYLQRHYFGLASFLNRAYVWTDPKTKLAWIGEKADGQLKFTSVFTGEEDAAAPQILDLPAIPDPAPPQADEAPAGDDAASDDAAGPYLAKPDKTTRGVPRYSRRSKLAPAVTDPDNRAFSTNIANRLWALMMGRGLVEPIDMQHADADVSLPELLQLLADDLRDSDYDLRRTIRQIALSRTYQRASRWPTDSAIADPGGEPSAPHAAALLKPLTPEQLAWSMMVATGVYQQTRQQAAAQKGLPQAPDQRARVIERAVTAQLDKHVGQFVSVFASGNELSRFDATARQALFLRNGPLLSEWLQPSPGRLVAKLQATPDKHLADELYLHVLSRPPAPNETQAVAGFVSSYGPQRRLEAIQALVRTLLCSAEFRFNH